MSPWFRTNSKPAEQHLTHVSKGFVCVADIDFVGKSASSEDRRYLLAWSDSDQASGRGGLRESGFGRYVLAYDNKVELVGSAERPNSGKVANDGTFILNDWMFGDGLKGTFLAFDKSGISTIKHHFSANLYNNGISENGEFAVCQLCFSDSKDSGVLAFFDLNKRELLWKKAPESGWADHYVFNIKDDQLILSYREIGEFRYRLNGQLLDEQKLERVTFERASGFELHMRAKEQAKRAKEDRSSQELEAALKILEVALQRDLDRYPNERASIFRTMGEINESLGKPTEALALYQSALDLNPKVGLMRKVAAMKKGVA